MSWGRYLDTWVVDRVMFEFVNQGGCQCCGFAHGGMDMADFMALCSDVETDDGKTEQKSPWPKFMQDEVGYTRNRFKFIFTFKLSLGLHSVYFCIYIYIQVKVYIFMLFNRRSMICLLIS